MSKQIQCRERGSEIISLRAKNLAVLKINHLATYEMKDIENEISPVCQDNEYQGILKPPDYNIIVVTWRCNCMYSSRGRGLLLHAELHLHVFTNVKMALH